MGARETRESSTRETASLHALLRMKADVSVPARVSSLFPQYKTRLQRRRSHCSRLAHEIGWATDPLTQSADISQDCTSSTAKRLKGMTLLTHVPSFLDTASPVPCSTSLTSGKYHQCSAAGLLQLVPRPLESATLGNDNLATATSNPLCRIACSTMPPRCLCNQ